MSEKWLKCEVIVKKILILAVLAGVAAALFLMSPYIISLFLPFIAAYIISLIASPLAHFFERIKIPRAFSAIISILVVAAALFSLSAAIISKIVSEIYNFSLSLPTLYSSAASALSQVRIAALDFYKLVPDELDPYIAKGLESLPATLSGISSAVVEFISSATINVVRHIPGLLIAVVFSVLASYFMIRDRKLIRQYMPKIVGSDIYSKLRQMKAYLHEAVFAYFRAQCILMSITFAEVFIALSILGINYSLLLALIIALVDAIPVFGTGTILIPWALYHLAVGNFPTASGLILLYAVCLIVRQILEPKILSSQIGVHPLITLLSLYVGYRFLGVFGMILGYITTLVVKNLIFNYYFSPASHQ